MAYIDKLLDKFNKVKSAVNSIKGIAAKIEGINYVSGIDSLGEQTEEAFRQLELRQKSLESTRKGLREGKFHTQKEPEEYGEQIIYPRHEALVNYLTFDIRPRRRRAGMGAKVGQTDFTEGVDVGYKSPGEVEAIANHTGVFVRRAISLYVPDALISQSSVQYRQEGISTLNRALADAATEIGESGWSTDWWKVGSQTVSKLGSKFLYETLNKMSGGLSNLRFGRASNPQQEQFLDNVPLRSWDFTFDFWPKSREEADDVRRIINIFRESMLPDTFADAYGEDAAKGKNLNSDNVINASYYNYPNMFEIYFSGPIADKIDGFLPAYCTNAQVDYTGGQKFSTFDDGMPVHVQLTLNFLEVKAMTLGNYRHISAIQNEGKRFGSNTSMNTSIGEQANMGNIDDGMTWEEGKAQGFSDAQLISMGIPRQIGTAAGTAVPPHFKKNRGNSSRPSGGGGSY